MSKPKYVTINWPVVRKEIAALAHADLYNGKHAFAPMREGTFRILFRKKRAQSHYVIEGRLDG